MNNFEVMVGDGKNAKISFVIEENLVKLNNKSRFGITGKISVDGETDEYNSGTIFMTYGEAEQWCRWLCENQVLPISMKEVLSDALNVLIG